MALKTYEAFTAPSPYDQERMRAERLRRYAELLQQQSMEPEGEFTYQGIRAMPSPAAALGKMLQAYQSKKALEKAEQAEAKQAGMEQEASSQIMGRLMGGRTPGTMADLQEVTPAGKIGPAAPENLTEVQLESQYTRSPQDAIRMAMSPQGLGAMRRNPLLAAALQKSMETPAAEEFYAPTETEGGLVQFGKRGGRKDTGVQAAPKAATPTELARLMAERDALPPNDPRRPTYDAAIANAASSKAPVTNIDLGPKDTFKLEADLRGEYKDQLKEYQAVRDSYQKIENALKTGAGDIAVVYAFAKLNDPTSVVRESEFETVAKSGSLGQRIKNLVEQAQTGKMNPELRENLRQQARQMYLTRQQQAEGVAQQYRDLAQSYGLNPQKVLAGININNVAGDDDIVDLPPRR